MSKRRPLAKVVLMSEIKTNKRLAMNQQIVARSRSRRRPAAAAPATRLDINDCVMLASVVGMGLVCFACLALVWAVVKG